jgi:hypothetical protein
MAQIESLEIRKLWKVRFFSYGERLFQLCLIHKICYL